MSEGEEIFGECETAPSNMYMPSMDPNFEYLLRNYSEDIRSLTGIKERPYSIFLHDDGWLEIEVEFDSIRFAENTEEKVKNYVELIEKIKPSKARWKALDKTVTYFQGFGRIVLVRIPVSPQMEAIESQYYPKFEKEIRDFSKRKDIILLDYFHLNDSLHFTDGNHLHRNSARLFSRILGADLRSN
jgi:hypothetical protein